MKFDIPAQKKSFKSKQSFENWQKPSIEGYINQCVFFQDMEFRNNLVENYNLDNGILDEASVEKWSNPFGISGQLSPAKIQHYPSSTIRIDLLVGEESRRNLDYSIVSTNPTAVSSKMNAKKEEFFRRLMQISLDPEATEATKKFNTKKLEEWSRYEFRDHVELMGQRLLNKLLKDVEAPVIFNRCFRDLLVGGMPVANVEIRGDKIFARRCNPKGIFPVMSGDSQYLDEAEAILEVTYNTPGKIVDFFQDKLKPKDIDNIWKRGGISSNSKGTIMYNFDEDTNSVPVFTSAEDAKKAFFGDYILGVGPAYDEHNNIRVMRLVWASFRKIGFLTYYDEETGDALEKMVDENHTPDIEMGESIRYKWIKEYWKSVKILDNIYIDIEPIPIQIKGNGYVGTINSVDGYVIRSLMDRMKPFEYLYDVFLYRLESAITRSIGKISTLDMSKKPKGMSEDQWIYYITTLGINIEDSFNSTNEGIAAGKIAGNYASRGTMEIDASSVIQTNMMMLQYLDDTLSNISGVTRQRLGQIESRETVGGTERAIRQSASQTEPWYFIHDRFKLRFYNTLLNMGIYLYKDKEELLQNFMDDSSIEVINIIGYDMMAAGLEVVATFSQDEAQLQQLLKEYSFAALQNNRVLFSDAIKVFRSNSNIEKVKILEQSEDNIRMEQQQMAEQQQAVITAQEDKKFQQEVYLKQMEIDAKRTDRDLDNDGINDEVELKKQEMQKELKLEEIKSKERMKDKEIKSQEKMNSDDNKTKESISRKNINK